ncbi:class I SAM-dependent methyltransferase [Actinomadura parmotrematis]|uniref:Methyltransferase MycE N-terminal domain-containing protein n=1 Tax=Actinomadura parmotrematis TaxID=2864039 RepID=A0ABS7FV53_9ACTN|nr:class I SAM-dependent methyltransferase [Actinomadura parmotrematis]MBW8484303.1 hypothetical protein [Actinomadura parmotrematis]
MTPLRPSDEPVARLVRAAGGDAGDRDAAVAALGAAAVAGLLVEEVLARCDPLPADRPVRLGLDLLHGDLVLHHGLTVAAGGVTAEAGAPDGPAGRIRCSLTGLLRALYGTRRGLPDVEVEMCWPPLEAVPGWIGAASRATECVLGAFGPGDAGLDRLAVRYGSDKWGALHWYTPHYDRHFAALRDEPVRLLEIGVGGYADPDAGGASLRMWQRYFRRGLIYGLDVFAKPGVTGPRIRVLRGDQADPDLLAEIGRGLGPFDIVIDDGSHVSRDVLASLRGLFPHLRPGGLYAVEDLQTSYWPAFGGGPPDGPAETTVGFLAALVDGLHHQERGGEPGPFDRTVAGLHCYRGLAVVEKGANTGPGAPAWVPREA